MVYLIGKWKSSIGVRCIIDRGRVGKSQKKVEVVAARANASGLSSASMGKEGRRVQVHLASILPTSNSDSRCEENILLPGKGRLVGSSSGKSANIGRPMAIPSTLPSFATHSLFSPSNEHVADSPLPAPSMLAIFFAQLIISISTQAPDRVQD